MKNSDYLFWLLVCVFIISLISWKFTDSIVNLAIGFFVCRAIEGIK